MIHPQCHVTIDMPSLRWHSTRKATSAHCLDLMECRVVLAKETEVGWDVRNLLNGSAANILLRAGVCRIVCEELSTGVDANVAATGILECAARHADALALVLLDCVAFSIDDAGGAVRVHRVHGNVVPEKAILQGGSVLCEDSAARRSGENAVCRRRAQSAQGGCHPDGNETERRCYQTFAAC
jgi:hypothetical protein